MAFGSPFKIDIMKPKTNTEQIEDIVKQLDKQMVMFPEIQGGPFKLGTFYEATIKIGDDEPQEKRILFATMLMPDPKIPRNVDELADQTKHLNALTGLMSGRKNGIMTAYHSTTDKVANPTILVLYPGPLGGYMTPCMGDFAFYGTETIQVSELVKCDQAASFFNNPGPYTKGNYVSSGSLVGRKLDGLEVFETA